MEIIEIYGELKKLYNASKTSEEKETIRKTIIASQLAIPLHHIECLCGEKFETDKEFIEYYVDSVILSQSGKKVGITKSHALAKWQHHKDELIKRVDNAHAWMENRDTAVASRRFE